MPKSLPIPEKLHSFVTDLMELCKSAADEIDAKDQRIAELEEVVATKQAAAPQEITAPVFDHSQLLDWIDKMKEASILHVPEGKELDPEKLAAFIEQNPGWLVESLLAPQLPPASQGAPVKEASQLSGESSLVDHDGWLSCLP